MKVVCRQYVLLVCVVALGCGQKPKDLIIGTWINPGISQKKGFPSFPLVFEADGTCQTGGIKSTYKHEQGNTFSLINPVDNEPMYFECTFDGPDAMVYTILEKDGDDFKGKRGDTSLRLQRLK